MSHDAQRRPDEIEADIAYTRGNLDRTLSAIEQRLNPDRLFDQGVDYLRGHGAREYAANLGQTAKREPIPLALVGIGLAWLMQASRHNHAYDPAAAPAGSVDGLKDKAAATSQRISGAAHAARERAGRVSSSARAQAQRVRGGYERLAHDQPLALGAIGLAIGAVCAALAPRTHEEDELMGAARDRLADRTTEAARDELDQVKAGTPPHRDAGVDAGDGAHHLEPTLQPHASATEATPYPRYADEPSH